MNIVSFKKIARGIGTSFLALLLIGTPLSPTLETKIAEAQIPAIEVGALTAKDAGLFGVISGDAIAWGIINGLVEQMLQSTIDWVNSGFEGKPTFVTDFKAFALDVGDMYALDFIWDNNLLDLCSPFRTNIQLALESQYASSREFYAGCRLTTALKNIQNLTSFHNGSIMQAGGWDAWHAVTTNREMYAMGAYFESNLALRAGVTNARGQSLFETGVVGNGFLSKKVCENEEAQTGCVIQTPGTVIQNYLSNTLSIPGERLSIADELNELLASLVTQLASRLLGGVGGLLGSNSGGGNSAAGAYFNSLRDTSMQQPLTTPEGPIPTIYTNTSDTYMGLLQASVTKIASCDGEIPPSAQSDIVAHQQWLLDEIQDVLFGRKEVTATDISTYTNTKALEIEQTLRQLPGTARCEL